MENRGFTLIELLVVISIIGMLASIVLVSLASARNKGSDAKTIQQLEQLRVASELYYQENHTFVPAEAKPWVHSPPGPFDRSDSCSGFVNASYIDDYNSNDDASGDFFTDTNIANHILKNTFDSAGIDVANGTICGINNKSWAIVVSLKASPNTYWCVDSHNTSKIYSGSINDVVGGEDGNGYACGLGN